MNKLILVLGLTGLLTGYITFTLIFFSAVFNGGEILVRVNHYNEMYIEIVMNLIFIPFVILFVHNLITTYFLK